MTSEEDYCVGCFLERHPCSKEDSLRCNNYGVEKPQKDYKLAHKGIK